MWILTVVLMMSSGDISLVRVEVGPRVEVCQTMARNVLGLEDMGLHILSVTCSREKGA